MSQAIASRPLPDLGVSAAWGAFARAQQGRFALWLPVFMAAGIAAYFSLDEEPRAWVGLGVFLPAALLAWLGRRIGARPMLAPVAAAALGFAAAQFATDRAPPLTPMPGKAVVVTGIVRGVDVLPGGLRVILSAPRLNGAEPLPRTIRVRLRANDMAVPAAGDTVRVRALLMPPPDPAYPGAWDLQRDAFFSGLGGSGFAIQRAEVLAHAEPSGVVAWLRALRDGINARIAAVLPGARGAIAGTLLTGAGTSIPEMDRAAFRDSGLAHLLAVAGLHIGIVMGLFFGLARRGVALWEWAALRLPGKAIAAVTALAAGGMYMVLTGAHVPIIRSFAMACVVTLAIVVGRRAISLRSWAIAACVLMLISPWEVMSVSFQMSFSAVLALIAGYEALRPRLRALYGSGSRRRRVASHIVALALTSFLAGTASAPFGAYHFGHVQAYYVVSNLFGVPLTAFWVLPLGVASLALMPLGLEQFALVPMGWGVDGLLWIAHTTANAPAATIAVPHIQSWGLAVLSVGIAWLGLWRGPVRLAGVALIAAGLLSAATADPPDFLVSPDAKLIGARAGNRLFVQAAGSERFVRDAWAQHMATLPAEGLDDMPGAACGGVGCRIGPALIVRDAAAVHDCGDAAFLLSASPAGDACAGRVVIDKPTVRRLGAAEIWADGRVVFDRPWRGRRPWVPGGALAARGLPLAETE